MQKLATNHVGSQVIYPFIRDTSKQNEALGREKDLRSRMPVDLGRHLEMRFCESKDIPRAVSLFDDVWKRPSFRTWFENLMSGRHPNVSFRDFTIVEDQSTGHLVSLMGLVSQTWVYRGVPFGCGQPEAVVTHPAYRQHGLIRKQMGIIHELSKARGEQVQVIWGNPWYYRQFGYEYAVDGLWDTHRKIRAHHIPPAKDPMANLCRLRVIHPKDYGFIRQLHEHCENRSIIRTEKSFDEWRFHFEGWTKGAHARREWRIIEHPNGSPAGFLSFHNEPDSGGFGVHQLEITQETGYLQMMPSILRLLWDLAIDENQGNPPEDIKLYLGREHPAYQSLLRSTHLHRSEMECLYIRVQDIVAFLRHITPALNNNLAQSPASDFTGTLHITLFRGGLEIVMNSGSISGINPWQADDFWHTPAFPDLTFLQLVFGRRRCAELSDIFVDCNVDDVSALVLDSLFPPFKGTIWLGN